MLAWKPTWAVVEAGGGMALAFETASNLPVMLIIVTAKIAREWGFEPWRSQDASGPYAPHAVAKVNWPELRKKAGEPDRRPLFPVPG